MQYTINKCFTLQYTPTGNLQKYKNKNDLSPPFRPHSPQRHQKSRSTASVSPLNVPANGVATPPFCQSFFLSCSFVLPSFFLSTRKNEGRSEVERRKKERTNKHVLTKVEVSWCKYWKISESWRKLGKVGVNAAEKKVTYARGTGWWAATGALPIGRHWQKKRPARDAVRGLLLSNQDSNLD